MRPHILITAEPVAGLCSVEELQKKVCTGLAERMWAQLHDQAQGDVQREPYTPRSSHVSGRSDDHAKHANRDYRICEAAGLRLQRAALAHLITGDVQFRDSTLRQYEVLFDVAHWPAWIDKSHEAHGYEADLRTGMLSRDLALAYDWLHPALNAEQRRWIVEGIDRFGIQPYWRSIEKDAPWANKMDNWLTVIVGGLGMAGMALGEDHPQSQQLIDFAQPRMEQFLDVLGPEGEFNESVGYMAAMYSVVQYFAAHQCHDPAHTLRLAQAPFLPFAYWQMHMTLPPGRPALFGDCWVNAKVRAAYIAPIAAAANDPVLQGYFLEHYEPNGEDPAPLLWFDGALDARSPEGVVSCGRAYRGYGKVMCSRSDWNARATHCVVYGKAGREANHEHNDVGQVCIDGFGQRLIVDLGSPSAYPPDYFRHATRWDYYNASTRGHNVLMFNGQEMRSEKGVNRGRLLDCAFDDAQGGWWRIDTSDAYDSPVGRVRRTMAHLLPGVVAVLDEAELEEPASISLRWHTCDAAEPSEQGCFQVVGEQGAQLVGRVVACDGQSLHFRRSEHAYVPPQDKNRLGEPLAQRGESYIDVTLTSDRCRLLTLFAVLAPNEVPGMWTWSNGVGEIRTAQGGGAKVCCTDDRLEVTRVAPNHPNDGVTVNV